MKTRKRERISLFLILAAAILVGMVFGLPAANAAAPVVKTVPWVASQPLVAHDTWVGKSIRLKGTSDVEGGNIQYTWDFGDGSAVATGTVTNKYVIEASHTYSGTVGTVFTARLTVKDTTTGQTGSKEYYVKIEDQSLQTEVNVAIDEGLWKLHKDMYRWDSGATLYGDWRNWSTWYSLQGANINAFEVNGHLESGDPGNPYVETVQRAMHRLFELIHDTAIGLQHSDNPDTNGNDIGIRVWQDDGHDLYQSGMVMDAIVASGTPNAIAPTGPTNVIGRKYKEIVQDMLDWYAYCQSDNWDIGGAWRYSCNQDPDNSASQWGAIGLIAAERNWNITIPAWVKTWNQKWLIFSHNPAGYFGYTDQNPVWGPYAVTPSGMVQLVMNGLGRSYSNDPGNYSQFDKAETFIRNNWDNAGGYSYPIKTYYYGMFSFTKAMLLHQKMVGGALVLDPITMLHSNTAGVADIDWYGAQTSKGAPTDGVARTLVNGQHSDGYWWYHSPDGNMYAFETAWAIMMLNRTVFESGAPVAVAKAVPNPAVAGQTIVLDGSLSFHQDQSKQIVQWDWDLTGTGSAYTLHGPSITLTGGFPSVGSYPVKLRVTDNGDPLKTADTIVTIVVDTPPLAPTANAGGPYTFCPQIPKWYLDGSKSVNPDNGRHEAGAPGDFIKSYDWDLLGTGSFNDAHGVSPEVKATLSARGSGSFNIQLKVTDNTALSFPSSGKPDQTSTASAQVRVLASTDPACTCITNLTARAKSGEVQLTWTNIQGTNHYNVYRGTTAGGPYAFVASTTSTYSTYLDTTVTNGTTYYYIVRPAGLDTRETCQSNEANAKPAGRTR
jgi:hypothetical protein